MRIATEEDHQRDREQADDDDPVGVGELEPAMAELMREVVVARHDCGETRKPLNEVLAASSRIAAEEICTM